MVRGPVKRVSAKWQGSREKGRGILTLDLLFFGDLEKNWYSKRSLPPEVNGSGQKAQREFWQE
jgi:hypothetical protein